jgi:hypothetical protein
MPVIRTFVAATAFVFCVAVACAPGAHAAPPEPGVKIVAASIGGHSLTAPTRDNPVIIDPNVPAELSMTLRNDTPVAVHVRFLRLSGLVLGIRFVNFQGSANTDIPAGATRTVSVPGDFFDVDRAASGYINGEMQAANEQRGALASQKFVADIQGRFLSSEGILLLEILALAVISLVDIGVSVARRRLPRNRLISGFLFAFAAASTVLTIVIAAAMARVALFETTSWVPALFVATAGAFVLGYLSPGRLTKTAPDAADDAVIDLVAADAVARATGDYERRTTGGTVAHTSGDHTGVAAGLDQSSGSFAAAHDSGSFAPASHESGGFTPPAHESGEFDPPSPHESGGFEPLE